MSEMMLERVARACAEAGFHGWPETDGYNDHAEKQAWRRVAHAAIETLREMTEEMRVAAITTGLPMKIGDPPLYEAIWRNILDAILDDIPVEPLPPVPASGGQP